MELKWGYIMNGYFKIELNEQGTFIHLIPETDGGTPLKIEDVSAYLEFHKIPFDIKEVYAGLQSGKETKVHLAVDRTFPINERAVIKVAEDKMSVIMRCYPPSNDGKLMDGAEILHDLEFQKITYGIKQEVIDGFLQNREYCKDYVVAVGQKIVHGKDARIEYFFNTDVKVRPTLLEDGSVDFFNLNIVNHCQKGDLLARLYPDEPGEAGINVFGESIQPPTVKKLALKFGHNIELSEDKTEIKSEVNGHVSLVDDRVFVSNVYEVENVDNSTGNIEYEGSVKINGNVCANFKVVAQGDIEVAGIVEGAYLEAGGNIVIARGMNGMERGELKAGGNIIAKFLENAKASAKGYVDAESILHSHVMAGTEVHVTGKKAFITGGTVSAANLVSAKTYGSPMAAATTVEVGIDPNLKVRVQELQKEIQELQKSIQKVDPVVNAAAMKLKQGIKLTAEQLNYARTLAATSQELHKKLDDSIRESEELKEKLDSETEASIAVTGVIYPGTRLVISGASLMIKEEYKYCRFKKIRGDVKSDLL